MIQILSEITSASSLSDVPTIISLFYFHSFIFYQNIRLNRVSSPIVGSFKITTSGSPMKAQAKHSFFLFPPESAFTSFMLSSSIMLN